MNRISSRLLLVVLVASVSGCSQPNPPEVGDTGTGTSEPAGVRLVVERISAERGNCYAAVEDRVCLGLDVAVTNSGETALSTRLDRWSATTTNGTTLGMPRKNAGPDDVPAGASARFMLGFSGGLYESLVELQLEGAARSARAAVPPRAPGPPPWRDEGERVDRLVVFAVATNLDADGAEEGAVDVTGEADDDFRAFRFNATLEIRLEGKVSGLPDSAYAFVANWTRGITVDDFRGAHPVWRHTIDDDVLEPGRTYRAFVTAHVERAVAQLEAQDVFAYPNPSP